MAYRTDIPGWLHQDEANAIERICKVIPTGKTIIEVGVYAGRTTAVLTDACPLSTIYCIDPWWKSDPPKEHSGFAEYTGEPFTSNDVQWIFRHNIADNYPKVIEIQGEFPQDLPDDAKTNVGMIHWDTDSILNLDRTMNELTVAWNLLDPGGVLSGHTFAHWMPNVVYVVRTLGNEQNTEIILPPGGSIWYAIKS